MSDRRTVINDQYLREMHFDGTQVIMHTDGILCMTIPEVVNSRAFEAILYMFLDRLVEKGAPIIDSLRSDVGTPAGRSYLLRLLRTLSEMPLEHAAKTVPSADAYLENPRPLYLFVEKFYDFWRSFDGTSSATPSRAPRATTCALPDLTATTEGSRTWRGGCTGTSARPSPGSTAASTGRCPRAPTSG